MTAGRQDLIIEKNCKFYQELQIKNEDGTTKSLVGYTVRCIIKESPATSTVLFDLTEGNGGVEVLDDPNASFALSIDADDLDLDASVEYAQYEVLQVDANFPDQEIEKLLWGKILFSRGLQ